MQYEFLKAFPRRMKSVGLYALLFMNSSQKAIWKQFGFESPDLQLNMVFAILLFLMEQSLKEEPCTIDDIGVFTDQINSRFFQRPMTYEDCRELGDYIVNHILSNEGRPMYFEGYDFEEMTVQPIHISYIANKIIYRDEDIRRTSYYLTDDGYNLLLGTLEVENNMKLTIQEMVFRMHLEKQSYDRALDDIKGVFNLMRIQNKKIAGAMGRIRRNVLDYSVSDYEQLLQEDLATITETREKFRGYRETVRLRAKELEETRTDFRTLHETEGEKLRNLKEIEGYLNRTIDEHQRILNGHFDLKTLYSEELERISEMSLVRRFSFRRELFDKVLGEPSSLDRLDLFFHPLFNRDPERVFNLNKAFEPQQVQKGEEEDDGSVELDFDEDSWFREQERLKRIKLGKYEKSLTLILREAVLKKSVSLSELREMTEGTGDRQVLIPDINIFKEIMVELIRAGTIRIADLKKERAEYIEEETGDFRLHDMILRVLDSHPDWPPVPAVVVEKIPAAPPVVFGDITGENGSSRAVRCTEVRIRTEQGETDGI